VFMMLPNGAFLNGERLERQTADRLLAGSPEPISRDNLLQILYVLDIHFVPPLTLSRNLHELQLSYLDERGGMHLYLAGARGWPHTERCPYGSDGWCTALPQLRGRTLSAARVQRVDGWRRASNAACPRR
jgi:hypothetical protein